MEQEFIESSVPKKLSKNALKKQAKLAKRQENAAEWKQKQKELRKQRRQARKGQPKAPNPDRLPIISDNFTVCGNVAIDLSFVELMNDKELKSFASQVMRCYSLNRRFQKRFNLILIEATETRLEILRKLLPNMDQWGLDTQFKSLAQINDEKIQVTYLTADSPNILDTLKTEDLIIIGGLVDHNRFKRICIDKAESIPVSTARLPLFENVSLSGSKVLTIVNVYEILLRYNELGDWKRSLELSIPKRKQAQDEINT